MPPPEVFPSATPYAEYAQANGNFGGILDPTF
jgi:hypothetical protein